MKRVQKTEKQFQPELQFLISLVTVVSQTCQEDCCAAAAESKYVSLSNWETKCNDQGTSLYKEGNEILDTFTSTCERKGRSIMYKTFQFSVSVIAIHINIADFNLQMKDLLFEWRKRKTGWKYEMQEHESF